MNSKLVFVVYGLLILLGVTATDNDGWTPVGTLVDEYPSNAETQDDEQLIDVSDPEILSDEACSMLLTTLDSEPGNVTTVLDDMKLDLPAVVRRGRCYRSIDYGNRHNVAGFCAGPLYIIYGGYRYCCRNPFEHPLLLRGGSRIRCSCLYD
ncbi:uncharacterized protein [Macrobrachium rosenbergii]